MKEKTLELFCTMNPFEYSNEQLKKLQYDFKNPKKGLISDEVVDFILWCEYGLSRQDYFANYVTKIFDKKKYSSLLEVGCGYNARLSKLLSSQGYQMSSIDPKVNINNTDNSITLISSVFDYKTTNIDMYDAIIAEEPCDATEHIIRACIRERKDFIIALCGVPHKYIDGIMPKNCDEWYSYLVNLDKEHIFLLRHISLIPDINSNIIIGLFNND